MPQNPRLMKAVYAQRAADEFLHNPDLVRVVRVKRPAYPASAFGPRLPPQRVRGKTFNLVTPFAGKPFLAQYLRGLDRLPLAQAHGVFYDNSNSPQFRARLEREVLPRFDSYTLIEDRNPQFTAERTTDYARISYRCHRIYQYLYETAIAGGLPLCLNIEDDTEVPAGTWERLNAALALDPKIATAVGVQCSRRMADETRCLPMAWNFARTEIVGTEEPAEVVDQRLIAPKSMGIETIGSAHMACWLTRTPVIQKLGMAYGWDGVNAQDMCWGYALNTSGYRMVIDWGLRTRHYYKEGRKTLFV